MSLWDCFDYGVIVYLSVVDLYLFLLDSVSLWNRLCIFVVVLCLFGIELCIFVVTGVIFHLFHIIVASFFVSLCWSLVPG